MTTRFTRSDYAKLPEEYPAQLIEGCLVKRATPVVGHQRIVGDILVQLIDLVGSRLVGLGPLDVPIDEHNMFHVDLCVLRHPLDDDAADVGVPLLVVEVLSPESAHLDRVIKRARYLDAGVEEVWIIDRDNRMIEVFDQWRYRDIPRRATGGECIRSNVVPTLSMQPRELFTRHPNSV